MPMQTRTRLSHLIHRRPVATALIGGCVLTMFVIILEAVQPHPVRIDSAAAPSMKLPELPSLRAVAPARTEFADTIERPLFRRDRRPEAVTETATQISSPPDGATLRPLVLTAIVAIDGMRTAMFVDGSNHELIELGLGDEIDGWRLESIGAKSARLTRDDESRAFALFESNHPSTS